MLYGAINKVFKLNLVESKYFQAIKNNKSINATKIKINFYRVRISIEIVQKRLLGRGLKIRRHASS